MGGPNLNTSPIKSPIGHRKMSEHCYLDQQSMDLVAILDARQAKLEYKQLQMPR